MDRRQMIAGLAASAVAGFGAQAASPVNNSYLEVQTWHFHNSQENQATRTSQFLQSGLVPALSRANAQFVGAFQNVIGQGGPYYVTVTQYASLAAMQDALTKLAADEAYQQAVREWSNGPGLPFVRVESSLLRSFDVMPQATIPKDVANRPARIFELRMYENQSFAARNTKVGMFNQGEAAIFERLGMKPVFFGETLIGPKLPNVMYMLTYDSLADRDRLWHAFGSDPEWKKLRAQPQLADSEIVANISNVILSPLPFSPVR
jgi:NIPSNAP protein